MLGLPALYRTLAARRAIVGWAVLVGAAVALSAGLALPKIYESSATVLVDSIQKDTVTGLYEPRLRVAEFLGQQAAIASSRTVALETFNLLADEGFIAFADFEQRWRRETGGELVIGNDARLWAADELVRNLFIRADAVEGTLKIAYRGEDPSEAARIANGFAVSYMKTVLDQRQRRAARNAASFSEERQILERDLEGAQRELNKFREKAGIVALGEQRLEAAELELATLMARIADARADLSESESLLRQAQSVPQDGLLTLTLPDDVLSGRQAQARLGAVTSQLERIADRYGERYPDYLEVKREKESLEQNILQSIYDRTDFSRRRLEALEADASITKQEVVELQKVKETYEILENKVSANRDTYALVANRTLQEALQSRIENVDVVLLSRAVPPASSMTPPLVVIVLIGVALGAAFGSGVAVFVEFAEGRIRDAATLRQLLRAPVLAEIAVVPDAPVPAHRARRKGGRPILVPRRRAA
jgi:uncharacterized protein involved in exopolysaccharide biosynthesis